MANAFGLFEAPYEAVTMNLLGQCSMEGQGRQPNALSPSIYGPTRGLRQLMESQRGHRDKSRESSIPSSIDDNSGRVVTDRIDGSSPRTDYDNGGPTRSVGARKRSDPEGLFPSKVSKKRRIKPPKLSPDHELSSSFPLTCSPEELRPSRGGRKSEAKRLSIVPEADHYYRQNTSLDDQTYLYNIIKKLSAAPYLRHPQKIEPTISSEAGVALVGDIRVEGPGRAKGDESIYAILIDKPSSGPFLCWICGHLEKQRKALRVLGHVREHFKHRPWACTQNHARAQNGSDGHTKPQVIWMDAPW